MTTLYYTHDDFLYHDTGAGHPENAARLQYINSTVNTLLSDRLSKVEPVSSQSVQDLITLVHSPDHLHRILEAIPQQGHAYLDPDTVISPRSGRAALLAVSSVCDAVEQITSGHADNAFCAVRPPGHHAESGRAMGFCLFNNIAIAAAHARKNLGIGRIAIIDFDVHHGNGTQQAFYQQPEIIYASSHQMPFYPGTGNPAETGAGNIINVPLAAGDGSQPFRDKYRDIILPAVERFHPELILLSAGFDAHKDDPLASLRLETDDFYWVTRQIMEIAERCCSGRIISTLEGGYHLQALGDSAAAHVKALLKL